jgi:hypothetical protein
MSSEQGSATNENNDDWRLSVSQQYRNTEVREIAKVLAALEPGATSASKLMLAMRFEDAIFKAATSLTDYRKKLTKRLKRVQKSYVPTNTAAATNKEQLIKELRNKYGDSLRYISQHAAKAISELKAKHGQEKASQLQQHTAVALSWAQDLGLLSNTQPKFNMPQEQQMLGRCQTGSRGSLTIPGIGGTASAFLDGRVGGLHTSFALTGHCCTSPGADGALQLVLVWCSGPTV